MRVALDAHMLGSREGGNETYIAGLLRGLAAADDVAAEIAALHYPGAPQPTPPTPRLRYHALPRPSDWRRLALDLPRFCRQWRADVLHVTYNAPLRRPCPVVLSVHDVIFRLFPANFAPRVRLLLNTVLPLSMRRAARIITISQASRQSIEQFYPFTRGRVRVIPLAAGPLVDVAPDHAAAQAITGDRPYILTVGSLQPRKNMARLIAAYDLARREAGLTARLVIVGRALHRGTAVAAEARRSPFADDIVFTDYISDAALAALYTRCAVFVYPSLWEGFGLPVLEAMHLGAPVIASRSSALPEVAGQAARLVDPLSTAELAQALAAVAGDPAEQARLRAAGFAQAARFSWERTARATLAVYREVAA